MKWLNAEQQVTVTIYDEEHEEYLDKIMTVEEMLDTYTNEGCPTIYSNPEPARWIPVSEELPKENKTVIASTEYGVYPETRYSKKYGWEWAYEAGADYWEDLEDVTAWMPLPERYEPQESENKE